MKRLSPVGESIRYSILEYLYSKGWAAVEEVERIAREAVKRAGVLYDYTVWPALLEGEAVIYGDVVAITDEGRRVFEYTRRTVKEYLQRWGL